MMRTNYDPDTGTLPLSDARIDRAPYFAGWCSSYGRWQTHAAGWDHDPDHNAWHVAYLASALMEFGWVGKPPEVFRCGCVRDANHRVRAVRYLAARGVVVRVPPPVVLAERCWKGERCPGVKP